jgi:hypothetical protein
MGKPSGLRRKDTTPQISEKIAKDGKKRNHKTFDESNDLEEDNVIVESINKHETSNSNELLDNETEPEEFDQKHESIIRLKKIYEDANLLKFYNKKLKLKKSKQRNVPVETVDNDAMLSDDILSILDDAMNQSKEEQKTKTDIKIASISDYRYESKNIAKL